MTVVPPRLPSLCLLQLCEKEEEEEEELTERSEQDSGINEEPLLTAEQVPLTPMGISMQMEDEGEDGGCRIWDLSRGGGWKMNYPGS